MLLYFAQLPGVDHCRIGSLEMSAHQSRFYGYDHCRIGSLEIRLEEGGGSLRDHCRIGSLEMGHSSAVTTLD